MNNDSLASIIASFTHSTPPEWVRSLLPKLYSWDHTNWPLSQARALANIYNPQVRADFQALVDYWQKECPDIQGSAVALAFQSCLDSQKQYEQAQMDLVWTGPESSAIPLRRTDQALIQIIDSAKQKLLIVSFAVYKIGEIVVALQKALDRGIELRIVLEHPDASEGKITFSGEFALGLKVMRRSKLYVWPMEKRTISEDGKYGSLHAKVALADENLLFLSSANLTEYAMSLNMEMGVLVQGGDLPGQVRQHFDELISDEILRPIQTR